ncbi:putative receptor-like protein kinase [Raphanus sativus]|uniref:non-specific serine/threonine protein kinase n=3 Tax=Raphanus sativus TaxID=3726 RepID=A0A6J0JZY9_RAPSA|nr:putative receptor-like protein kinase At3g47110 isoform X1 [Raphanus sativus]KAJ4890441.1 putative receptor-like protein kinase [Raphanus sativus]
MGFPCTVMRLILVSAIFVIVPFEHRDMLCAQTVRLTEETDKQALLEFKSQVSETSRVVLDSWNDSLPLCMWTGIKCGSKHRRVTEVDLGGLKLTGVLSPFLGNLSFLRSLNLADNFFRGAIPIEVGNLFRLQYLNMSSNLLGGAIPDVLSNCSSLSSLDLSSNNLEQGVPSEFGSLSKLVLLSLGRNNLTGKFHASLGNLTSLQMLDIIYNQMDGEIPGSIARLKQMVFFRIALNRFTGVFPLPIYNMSSLVFLSITGNSFSGSLRPDFGSLLPNLQILYMGINNLTGSIPESLSNISNLQQLDIPSNYLTGKIPLSFGKLENLLRLGLNNNSLGNYSSGDLDFLGAMANCTQLQYLNVAMNKLGGQLPMSIANLSTQLTELSLGMNFISGSIPHGIANLVRLQALDMGENLLTGKLPPSFGQLSELRKVLLYSNQLSGEIPSSLGNITWLTYLYLINNSFVGNIPSSLGRCSYLLDLNLGTNELNGSIPRELMQLPSLIILNVSFNSLVGTLREDVGDLKFLLGLDVSYNKLSGQIPRSLGNCLSLEYLWLQGNSFVGPIPDITRLTGLRFLDLSKNNLSGPVPEYLANLSKLQNLNLSMNNFEGAVPTEGIFGNTSAMSIVGNVNLCGGIPSLQLRPCYVASSGKKHSSVRKIIAICVSAGIASVLLLSLSVFYICRHKQRMKNVRGSNNENDQSLSPVKSFYEKISYDELYKITGGFSSSNLIGSGNFGAVYKGSLGSKNKPVAIKVLNLSKRGAAKSFMAECEALGAVRHRNLVKLVTVCSSVDFEGNGFRALVYEFMANGNLDTWLHPEEEADGRSRALTFFERLSIAIDVASALVYLHTYCHFPIAHCDLKPSNILLDEDLTAHISDFGLARLLLKFDRESFHMKFSSTAVRGTIGYAAPEYGMGGHPSIVGDVYSFGILLLEMFTGKRPTDELFVDGLTLHGFTKSALQERRAVDVTDQSIIIRGCADEVEMVECLFQLVYQVGIRCSEESPVNRISMAEALSKLVSIRDTFIEDGKTLWVTKASIFSPEL